MATYERFFKSSCNNLETQIIRKLRDNNTPKSNITNPHYRCIVLQNVPRLTFAFKYGKQFLPEERRGVGDGVVSPHFEIRTLERLLSIIPAKVLVKVQTSGDTTLITPWVHTNSDMSIKFPDGKTTTFENGKLGIPLKQGNNKILTFFVCGGLDDNDEIPTWASEFKPKDIGIPATPEAYNEVNGVGIISLAKKDKDWTYIVKSQDIIDGDFLKVRGEFHEILGIVRDCLNPNQDCVRFSEDFKKNVAIYTVLKPPIFYGNMAWIAKEALSSHRPVTLQITKTDIDGFGQLNIQFQNACFNKLGFLVHDTAI